MNRRHWLRAGLGLSAAMFHPLGRAQAPAPPTAAPTPPIAPADGPVSPNAGVPPGAPEPTPRRVGDVKSLGNDRFQIGKIVVDKRAARFTVPGRVHVLDKPLEYLATSPSGRKEYETMLELDATGSEFNLACILLALERDPRQEPYRQFSPAPLVGPRVALSVAWTEGEKRRQVSAAEAMLDPDARVKPESIEWVYVGSGVSRQGLYAPDITGTLVGFVHDPNTIIEAVVPLGVGAYGSVRGNAALVPPVGSPIELIVEASPPRK